jgi:hypothetical protein
MEKKLGKIEEIHFGLGGYQGAKVYIVTNVEMGWDNIIFVTFDKTEAEKCKNSWGDTCVIHTKRIEDKYEEEL